MESFEATPPRPLALNPRNPNPSSPSPSPSPSPLRQWRPAAQRNLRNQWSRLLAAKSRWLSAAADGRSHATSLVNAHLSRRYMPATDLGVLKDMSGIREKACESLAQKEELYRNLFLLAYKEMVLAVSDLVKASHSMRCFLKVPVNSPLVQFCDHQVDMNDSGDGGGVPVFSSFSILEFENLAQELVEMFVLELYLKRLLVVNLLSIGCTEGGKQANLFEWSHELYYGEFDELQNSGLQSDENCPLPKNWQTNIPSTEQLASTPSHEVLQVYFTTWLSDVKINTRRIDEIFETVEKEMQVKLR